jgi:APA family basic amino acid/polyamine antiporter
VPSQNELKRQLGLGAAVSLLVGEVIAVGIFLTPAGMAKSLGSPLWLLIVWVVMGLMALCGALCYGELAARFPQAGGSYVYLREAYGPRIAFLYGWMLLLVLDPGLSAALAIGISKYAGYLVPLSPGGMKALGVGTILLIALVNILGVKLGAGVMQALTLLKLAFLAFIALWGFGGGLGDWSNFTPFAAQPPAPFIGSLAGGLIGAFFAFGGWWDVSKIAGEVREPARTLPRLFAYGVLIVTAVYIMTSAVFMYLVPVRSVASDETFAAQAGAALFGGTGAQVFSAIVVISVLGSLAAFMMTAPRVYYAMARDRLFFQSISEVSPRFGTPARAILLQAVLASLLVTFSSFSQIVAYFFFVTIVFIAMAVFAVFILRRRKNKTTFYLTPGYPWTPLFFTILISVLLVLLAANNPKQAFLGVGVVMLGLPVYQILFRKRATGDEPLAISK